MKFKKSQPTFICPVGPSGTGKSTYLRQHYGAEYIVEPDGIRREITGSVSDQSRDREVWAEVLRQILDKINTRGLAVLDATNTHSGNRGRILRELPPGTHKVALIFLPKGTNKEVVDILHGRITKDLEQGKDRSNVPRDVIERQLQQLKNGWQNIETQFDEIEYIDE
jgi:protein phosphatase